MARDGTATRQRIIEQAATLLNTQGYLSTPVSEIMRVTGLKKGGIYNHFESREALTLEAFEYAVGRMETRLTGALDGKESAAEKLLGLIDVFRNFAFDEAFRGGCPIMNLAIESDDANPVLRKAARRAMKRLVGLFERVIAEGVERNELGKMDPRARAQSMVAGIEGGIMLSNLFKDNSPLRSVLDQMEKQIRNGPG